MKAAIDPVSLLPQGPYFCFRYEGSRQAAAAVLGGGGMDVFAAPVADARRASIERFKSSFPMDAQPLRPVHRAKIN